MKPDPIVAQEQGSGFMRWRAGKDDQGSLIDGSYYFEVQRIGEPTVYSTKDSLDSNFHFLVVSDTEINQPPFANIVKPDDKQMYFIEELLNFTQNSYDIDDEFTFEWDLGNGVTVSGDSITKSNYSILYTYLGLSNLGQKNIKLTVTDDRGAVAKDQISILVINSTYILSYIDQPESPVIFSRIVDLDASSTYAVGTDTINNCEKQITCLAGNCPAQAAGCPPCYAENGLTCPINVINAPTPGNADYSNITFTWIFDDGISGNFTATGNSGVSFRKIFATIGTHTVKLITSLNPSSETEIEFDLFFNDPVCLIVDDFNEASFPGLDLGSSYWIDGNSLPDNSIDNCYDPSGIDVNSDPLTECCPFGYSCNTGSSVCEFQPSDKCQDFTTETECNLHVNNKNVATEELDPTLEDEFPGGCNGYSDVYGDFCFQYLNCGCGWNATASECQSVSKHKVGHIDPSNLSNIQTWDYETYLQILKLLVMK